MLRLSEEELIDAAASVPDRLDSVEDRSSFDTTPASDLVERLDYSPVFFDPLQQFFEQPVLQHLVQ